MPTVAEIKAHLLADPNKIGYAAHITVAEGGTATYTRDGDLESLGNAPNASLSVPIQLPIADLLKASAGDIYQAVKAFVANATSGTNQTMLGYCEAALQLFGTVQSLDFTDPNINYASAPYGMLQRLAGHNALGANGIQVPGPWTDQQLATLIAAGTKSTCSDFESAFGAGVYINHQQIAQALGRGNG